MIQYAQNKTRHHAFASKQRLEDNEPAVRCALLEGCMLRFALRPSRSVLDYITPIQSVLGSCKTLIVGVQVIIDTVQVASVCVRFDM